MTTHGSVAGSMRRTIEGLREANAGLCREHAALKARVEAVLALHHPMDAEDREAGLCFGCIERVVWPCPTRRALEGEP
jgi:hypothetical protein